MTGDRRFKGAKGNGRGDGRVAVKNPLLGLPAFALCSHLFADGSGSCQATKQPPLHPCAREPLTPSSPSWAGRRNVAAEVKSTLGRDHTSLAAQERQQ